MEDKHIVAVAEAIRYHLYRWPDASATLTEIARTWISGVGTMNHDIVLAALAQLEAQGFVERSLANDEPVWRMKRSNGAGSAA